MQLVQCFDDHRSAPRLVFNRFLHARKVLEHINLVENIRAPVRPCVRSL